jgi:hypothetical protein
MEEITRDWTNQAYPESGAKSIKGSMRISGLNVSTLCAQVKVEAQSTYWLKRQVEHITIDWERQEYWDHPNDDKYQCRVNQLKEKQQ